MTDQNHDHVCDPPCVFDRRAARTRLRQWCDRSEAVLGESDSEDVRMVRRRIADFRLIIQHSDHAEALEAEVASLRRRLAKEVDLRIAAGRLNPADVARQAQSLTPIVVTVPQDAMEVARDVIAQVARQVTSDAGVLLVPEVLQPYFERARPGVPSAPPVTEPSPRGTGERWLMVGGPDTLVIRIEEHADAEAVGRQVVEYLAQ